MRISANSEQETKNFGKKLATRLKGGDVVCLYGELGAGKTTLVKGIAKGLGITEEITSPTFTLMNIYQLQATSYPPDSPTAKPWRAGKLQALVHIDTYRLKNEKELIDIGAADYVGQPATVTVIEWPEKIESLLKGKKCIKIRLEHEEKGGRKIEISKV